MNIVDVLEHFYVERGAARYEIGGHGGVTQLQHALQCAALAADAQAADTLVAAALLHDLGHLLYEAADPELVSTRDDVHQYKALPFLRPYFPPAVLEPIKLHVDAKRYLCAVDPDYRTTLSAGSRVSLELQGGPFNGAQAQAFSALPFAAEAVQLRRWDDQAKNPALGVPPFPAYRERLARACGRAMPAELR